MGDEPQEPTAPPSPWVTPTPEPEPEATDGAVAARAWPGRVLVALTVVAVLGAGALYVGGRRADDRADAARAAAAQLRTRTRRVAAATERTSHEADGPIGIAEKAANSVSRIAGASGPVIDAAGAADDSLARAVDTANRGELATARAIYANEVSDAIRHVQELLDAAKAVLTEAQLAAAALAGQTQ